MQKDDDHAHEIAQAAMLYTKARDHFHDVLRKYVDSHLEGAELPRAPKPCVEVPLHEPKPCTPKVKTSLPDNVVPTLKWALVNVMGSDTVSVVEALERLKAKGWAPTNAHNRSYLAHYLGRSKKLFERKRFGFYRVRPGAPMPTLPKTRLAAAKNGAAKAPQAAKKAAIKTDDDILNELGIGLKTQPLGSVTRTVVRYLLSTFKEMEQFTATDAAVCRPAPHNTRDGVRPVLVALVNRGLVVSLGGGFFVIPDAKKLEIALIKSAAAAAFDQ